MELNFIAVAIIDFLSNQIAITLKTIIYIFSEKV